MNALFRSSHGCVSKSRCSIISSPKNSLSQTATSLVAQLFGITQNPKVESCIPSTLMTNHSVGMKMSNRIPVARFYYRIVGCCNGLLCLSDGLFGYTNSVILWNPAIRRKLTLPLPYGTLENLGDSVVVLGFAYDSKSHDYKVVRMTYIQGESFPPEIELYSVKNGYWRAINAPPPRSRVADFFWSQAFINGSVHWTAYCKSEPDTSHDGYTSDVQVHTYQCLIKLFDMHEEVFREMMLPASLAYELLVNMYASVILVILYDKNSFSIWAMKEYNVVESWSKQFTIPLDGGLGAAIAVKKDGDVLIAGNSGELVAHKSGVCKSASIGMLDTRESFYAHAYKEGLGLLFEGKRFGEGKKNDCDCDSSVDADESRMMLRRMSNW